jgi:hypothetical protein
MKGKMNPETGKEYTTPEILDVYKATGKTDKLDVREFEYKEEQAFNSLNAELSGFGGAFDPNTRSLIVPTDEKGNIDKNIKSALERSGFEYHEGSKITKTEANWIDPDKYGKQVFIGQYNPSGAVDKKADTKIAEQEDFSVPKQAPDGKFYIRKNGKLYLAIPKRKESGWNW